MSSNSGAANAVPTVLFQRRSSQKSDSASYDSSEDLWDDRILTDLYDRAVSVAREDVAKRLAMNTNSVKDAKMHKKEFNTNKKNKQNSIVNKKKWKIGSECRAVYSEDGLEYEATVIYIDGDNCIISYVGYKNEEEVKLRDLKPSLGKHDRLQQALEVADSNIDCEENSINGSSVNFSDGELKNNVKASANKTKSNKKKKNNVRNEYSLPPLSSFQFPSFSPNADLNSHIPLPPPPPFFPPTGDNASQDDQSLSVMLISWYMSGYYTGLYQGQKMKRSQE